MESLWNEKDRDIICSIPWRSIKSIEDLRMSFTWWGREVIIEWDSRIGNIINIAQIHYYPDSGLESYTDPIRYRLLALYQKAIYGELSSRKIEHVFIEWFKVEEDTSSLQIWKKQKQGLLRDPEHRDELFVKYGWAIVYFLENPKVRIYPTEEKDSQRQLDRYNISCEGQDLIHKKREDFTIRSVKKLLWQKPGLNIAMVYGARHLFWDNIKDIFWPDLPRMERVTFPGIAERYLERK